MKTEENEKHIVIAGMGFGGLSAALTLSRLPASQRAHSVTLVDRRSYHQFNATLYEVATAWMPHMPQGCLGVLKRTNCVPVAQLLLRMPGVTYRNGDIASIDPAAGALTFTDGTALHYDALIVALGSVTDDMGIPGIAQYAIGLKSVDDAMRIRCDMETAVADAAQDKRTQRTVRVLVGGGGFSGTEFSAELVQYAGVLSDAYRFPRERIAVEVIEASPHLLNGLGEWTSGKAEQRLAQLGVRMRFGTRIVRASARSVELSDGTSVPYDILVWTAGVRSNRLVRESGLAVDERGRLVVDATLRTSVPNVFGVGDAVAFTPPGAKHPLPWVASLAVEQGAQAARNAVRVLARRKPEPFTGQLKGYVIPIGGKFALAVLANGRRFAGFPAWVLRQFINLRYFLSILGPLEAFRVWASELTYYTRNDA